MVLRRKLVTFVAAAILVAVGAVQPFSANMVYSADSEDSSSTERPLAVVASTTWTAAIARAAGAVDVSVLAPAELRHPPEYDFKASDIAKVAGSALLVWAGYEPFVQRLIEAADVPAERVVRIRTANDPANLIAQARLLAERLNTTEAEQEWEARFGELVEQIEDNARAKSLSGIRVLVNYHQQPFISWLGYDVVGVFGPDELSPVKVAELASLKPDLVIDNYHTPLGQAIAEIAGCPRVELRNFPESESDTIEKLLADNAKKLGLL